MECKHLAFNFQRISQSLSGYKHTISHTDKQNPLTPLELFCIGLMFQIKKKNTQIFRQLWYQHFQERDRHKY